MRTIVAVSLSILVAGCAQDAQWLPPGGALYGRSTQAIDDEKCRDFGFQPGTEGYGNCRLQLVSSDTRN